MSGSQRPVYTMLYRPVATFTTPRGVATEWTRLPAGADHRMRRAFPDLEVSEHPFGEFTASRELTADELEQWQIKRVDPEFVRQSRMRELDERIDTLETERSLFASDPDETTALTQMIDEARTERDNLLTPATSEA